MTQFADTVALLKHLEGLDIRVHAEGDRLKIDAPKGRLTAELRALLSNHKVDLLRVCRNQTTAPTGYLPIPHTSPATAQPASFAQQRLWFLDRLEETGHTYSIPLFLRVEGKLDRNNLIRSVDEIVRRHQVLRTVFREPIGDATAPSQFVLPPFSAAEFVDLTHIDEAQREDTAARIVQESITKPFDLSTGPLFRLRIVRTGDDTHLLLFTVHHIVFDGLSVAIFLRELRTLYVAYSQDEPSPLVDLEIQYADFSAWQRSQLSGRALTESVTFFRDHLAGAPPLIELPTDRPRPVQQTFRGARQRFVVDSSTTTGLRAIAKKSGATLFMTLHAVFAAFLSRHTAQNDLVIGIPAANRNHAQLESLIGLFINTIPLRTRVDPTSPFTDLLMQVKELALQAFRHRDLPFEKLLHELDIRRDLAHNPIFQVMFAFQDEHFNEFGIPNLTISEFRFADTTAKFDLSLLMHDAIDSIVGIFEYNTDLFDSATIERWVNRFQIFLTAVANCSHVPIADLPLLTNEERHRLLVEWNDTAADYPRHACVHGLIAEQALRTPDSVAILSYDAERQTTSSPVTYRELVSRSQWFARRLRSIGIGPGTLVGVATDRSPAMLVALLGILEAGAAYVPLDPTYPRQRLGFMLEDAGISFLVTQSRLRQTIPTGNARVVELDEDWDGGDASNEIDIDTQSPLDPSTTLAYVIYTSGSTGQPKGVQITHRSLTNFLCSMQNRPGISAQDTFLSVTTLSFDIAALELYLPLISGATLVLVDHATARDGTALASAIANTGTSIMQATPATWRMLRAASWSGHPALTLFCGGEALPPSLAVELSQCGRALWNLYGPTETTIWSTMHRVESSDEVISIGGGPTGTVANTQLYVLDEALRLLPIGVPGKLYVGGEGVARGYLDRPALTRERFVANPFGPGTLYDTGDRVRWSSDGKLEYLGRSDHQVKLRGFRIELGEIETALEGHDAIEKAVVVARKAPSGENELAAYVTLCSFLDNPMTALRSWTKTRLPEHMVPTTITVLDALPLTPNGKIDRKALPEPNAMGCQSGYVPPRDGTELRMVQCWEKLLTRTPIGVRDEFFEMGGDSLLAIRLVNVIHKEFGVKLPLQALFRHGTIERLASFLRTNVISSPWSPLVCLQSRGAKTPFFFVHAAGGIVFRYLQLAAQLGSERPFYGLQARGVEPGDPFYGSIEGMANDYVAALRTVQPKGPYLLGGWSFGGTVAFAMARLLEQAGETVPLVVMVDAPSPFIDSFAEDDVEFLLERLGPAAGLALHRIDQHSSREEKLAYIFNEQRLAGLFAPDIDDAYARHRLALHKHHNEIICHYRPDASIAGKIIFYKPTETIPFDIHMKEPTTQWAPFASSGMDVDEAPGNHFNMFSQVNGPVLADKLKACIATHAFLFDKH